MRGDQLSPQWRVVRAIQANLKGLTVAEIAVSSDTFKFKISQNFRELKISGKGAKPLKISCSLFRLGER